MKKLWLVLFVLFLATLACVGPTKTQTPTLVPPISTIAVEPSDIPATLIPTIDQAPTEIPPTPIPPTEIPPTEIPPTPIPPTQAPVTEPVGQTEYIGPGVASGAEVVFEDDFTDSQLNWTEKSTERVVRAFVDGEFLMTVVTTDRVGWNYLPDMVFNHDVVLDVDVRGGMDFPEDGEAGFVCGFENDKNFYRMNVTADGRVKFVHKQNDENKTIYSASDSIPLDPAGSHLTAVCTQTDLSLYVNWQLAATYPIEGLPAGSAGLVGGANDTGNVELFFDNFIVSKGPYVFADGVYDIAPGLDEQMVYWGSGVVSGMEVVFEDDFSNSKLPWPKSNDELSMRDFLNGEFLMHIVDQQYTSWNYVPDVVFDHDVVLDVDLRSGANFPIDAMAGFVCGLEDEDNFFTVMVDGSGTVKFLRFLDAKWERLYYEYDAIPLNPAGVHLTGVCSQTEISLYADWQLVSTYAIDGLPIGTAGLIGGVYDTANVKLYFDNFYISKGPYIFSDGMNTPLNQRDDLLFFDDFSDENSGWDVRTMDDGGFSAYENGEYRIKVIKTNHDAWSNPNDALITGNVIVDVDVRMGDNPGDGIAAIACNYNMSTNDDFAVLGVDGEGYARIYEWVAGEMKQLFKAEMPIELKPKLNHLTAHCIDSTVTLLVNGQLVATATTNAPQADNVGLVAGTYEYGVTDFYYDDFMVFSVR